MTQNKCTIRLIRDSTKQREDDVIELFDDAEFEEMVRITFRPAHCNVREFYLPLNRAVNYVATVLKTLTLDTAPFENVQVDTQIHPAILYHVSDLDDRDVRYLIEDTVESALRRPVTMV
jgi:hypothetical protein